MFGSLSARLGLGLFLALSALPAQAAIVRGGFTGLITSGSAMIDNGSGTVTPAFGDGIDLEGKAITGKFRFDTDAASMTGNNSAADYVGGSGFLDFAVSIDGATYDFGSFAVEAGGEQGIASVASDPDSFSLTLQRDGTAAGGDYETISLLLFAGLADFLNSAALPLQFDFDAEPGGGFGMFQLGQIDAGLFAVASFDVISAFARPEASDVPAPGALGLLVLGISALVARRRRSAV